MPRRVSGGTSRLRLAEEDWGCLATLRKAAGVSKFTSHDLRRSCITAWARYLPIHVVQKLAGHSNINTTRQYYLSVQEENLEKARCVQSAILNGRPTDQLLTNSGVFAPLEQDKQKEANHVTD